MDTPRIGQQVTWANRWMRFAGTVIEVGPRESRVFYDNDDEGRMLVAHVENSILVAA